MGTPTARLFLVIICFVGLLGHSAPGGLSITCVRSDRAIYRPGEKGAIQVTVSNPTDGESTGRIEARIENGLTYSRDLPGLTHEMREAMAGGGLYMQEGIRTWRYTRKQYKTWDHYLSNELRVAKKIQSLGGYYHCIWSLGRLNPVQRYYKLVYGLIAGGHPYYARLEDVPGCDNWGAFMTRWSGMLWDRALRRVVKPAERFSVEGAERAVWKKMLQQRVVDARTKLYVQHLVTKPPSPKIAETGTVTGPEAPPTEVGPAEDAVPEIMGDLKHDLEEEPEPIRLRFRPPESEKFRRVTLIRPDAEPYSRELEATSEEGTWTVRGPAMEEQDWAMVVWQVEGEFTRPVPPPKFTEPPDRSKLQPAAKGTEAGVFDPNKPGRAAAPEPGVQIWETDSGFSGHGIQDIASDPAASGNLAQRRDIGKNPGTYPFMGRPWMGPMRPGRYRLGFRLKQEKREETSPAQWHLRVKNATKDENIVIGTLHTRGYENPRDRKRIVLEEGGDYNHYSLEFDLREPSLITADLWPIGQQGDYRMYLDHVRIWLLEAYPDAQIEQWHEVKKPDGLPSPSGDDPARAFHVRGLFWQSYGVEKLDGLEMESAYELPDSWEALYGHDVLVLSNVNVRRTGYEVRRMIRDWVEDGGRLVVFGGPETLGQGGMKDTYFESMLPFDLRGSREVVRCDPPLMLNASGRPGDEGEPAKRPALFWRHDVALRKGSRVLARAGEEPVATMRRAGSGAVCVFAGTVLGEGDEEHVPFWQTGRWKRLLRSMILVR